MPSINTSNNTVTVLLKAGKRMTVTTDATSTALAQWFIGDSYVSEKKFTSQESAKLGEFRVDMLIKITCLTGSLTYTNPTEDTAAIVGRATKTNDEAEAGEIGELIYSTVPIVSAVSLINGIAKDVTTITLTPGDWDVSGQVNRIWTGTTCQIMSTGLGVVADTLLTQAGGSGVGPDCLIQQNQTFGTAITGTQGQRIGPVKVSVAVDTVIHLVAKDTASAGSVSAYGTLRARRVR